MPRVERTLLIDVAPEVAFDYVSDHRNALRWMHNFTRFEPVLPNARGVGSKVNATGLAMGMPISTELEITEFEPSRRLASRTTGRLRSQSVWEFAPVDDGTRITFVGEYDLPNPLLRLIGASLVQRELETNAEMSLQNLKRELEGTAKSSFA